MKTAATFREISPDGSSKRQKTSDNDSSSTTKGPQSEDEDECVEVLDQRPQSAGKVLKESIVKEPLGSSDVLTLDVGGEKIVKTLRSTLTVAAGSKLAEVFSGRWDDSLPKNEKGNFFIDYKPDIFLPLLDYLRSLSSMNPSPPTSHAPPSTPAFTSQTDETALRFRIMVDAYDLTNVLYNYEIYQLKPDRPFFGADRATLVSKETTVTKYTMNADKGVAFVLDRPVSTGGDCHSRRVQAFEVTFVKDEGIKVGWTRRDLYRTQPINGMGKSISIDSKLALPGQHHFHDKAVIRCSKDIHTGVLTWYVDGKELVSTSHNLKDGANKIDDVVYVASGIASDCELIPLIVPARGSACRFSAIELEP